MPKKVHSIQQWLNNGSIQRQLCYQYYLTKYFNLFMGAYKFNGITPIEQDFILRKFWSEGKIASFILEGSKPMAGEEDRNDNPNGVIGFAPFAPFEFNIYDYPTKVNLIQLRGSKQIPTKPLEVDKDVVIGWCQRSKKPVLAVVDYYLERIVNTEMTIRVQLQSHKCPWLIACSPENETKFKRLFERIESDENVLYLDAGDVSALQTLTGGNAYIIDKLYQYKQAIENELLTYLGIDNLGILEKKEHMITDEVNSNNDLINDHSDNFLKPMQEFCDRINATFGYNISVEATSSPVSAEKSDPAEESEEDDYE